MNYKYRKIYQNKPRKIMNVKRSKYEMMGAIHTNKLYWNDVFSKMEFPNNAMPQNRLEKLSEVLPDELYKKVCDVLDIASDLDFFTEDDKLLKPLPRISSKQPLLSYRKSIIINRDLDSDTDVELSPREKDQNDGDTNIYYDFLQKPEREQVTWATRYLQPEREDEKSLVKKANDLTDRIANEFCEYMKQLGGNQQSQLFTPKAVKDLFDVEFDTHVARGLRIISKELPAIEENIAQVTGNEDKSKYKALEREITKDIKAEQCPDYLLAFNKSLPHKEQRRAPKNGTNNMWRSAKYVPKDLVTLKTVWEGITNLRSVKEYCRWMIEHPEYRRASYLSSLGMFDPAVLDARLTFEAQQDNFSPTASPHSAPTPIEHIRKRLSELTESK